MLALRRLLQPMLLGVLLLSSCCCNSGVVEGFVFPITKSGGVGLHHHHHHHRQRLPISTTTTSTSPSSSLSSSSQKTVEQLFEAIATAENNNDDNGDDNSSNERISQLVEKLEEQQQLSMEQGNESTSTTPSSSLSLSSIISPLFGYYNVTYTVKSNQQDNPVGGKWTRNKGIVQSILSTRRTLQHVLPYNTTGQASALASNIAIADAINVIILDAFQGFLQVTVLLRGDAVLLTEADQNNILVQQQRLQEKRNLKNKKNNKNKKSITSTTTTTTINEKMSNIPPLSKRAVKVYFGPPRIQIGRRKKGQNCKPWFNCCIGPTSNVVLDTTYIDEQVRIGMGGTSGTRFIFGRCRHDDEEAKECVQQLQYPITKTKNLILGCLSIAMIGLYTAFRIPLRLLPSSAATAATSTSSLLPLLFVRRFISFSMKFIGTFLTMSSLSFLGLVLTSSGGIERNELSYQVGKEEQEQETTKQ